MKDFIGQTLEVGDVVAVTPKNYRGMVKAQVVGFTPQQVRLEYINNWNFTPGKAEKYLVPGSACVRIQTKSSKS